MWLNFPGYISGIIIQPFASVFMFTILGRFARGTGQAIDYALGISVFSMAFVIINGIAQSYSYDRAFGTIAFVFVSSTNRLENFISRTMLHLPNALIAFSCGLSAAAMILDIHSSQINWPALTIAVLVLSLSISGAGQLLGIFSLAFRNWIAFQSMALGLLLLFSGVIIPTDSLPGLLAVAANGIPIKAGLQAVKSAVSGTPFNQLAPCLLREAMICLAYYVASFTGFVLFERRIKRSGALEQDLM